MGRISLSFRKALACFIFSFSVLAAEYEGVQLKDSMICAGVDLPLISAGLRDATIFNIRVYVLAMYSNVLVKDYKDPALDKRPMCFEVHYLRDVEKKKVDEAWEFQFKESSMYPYPTLASDIKLLQKYFGEIKKDQGVHLFEISDTGTKVYENGEYKGEIQEAQFGKNFISLFFGKNPPTKELRESLIKGLK